MGVHPGRPDEAADQELAEELPGLGGFRGGQTYWATIQAARRYTAPRIGRAVQRVANPVGDSNPVGAADGWRQGRGRSKASTSKQTSKAGPMGGSRRGFRPLPVERNL